MCKGKNVRNVTAYSRRVSVYSYYIHVIINNSSGVTLQVTVPKSVRHSHKFFVGNASLHSHKSFEVIRIHPVLGAQTGYILPKATELVNAKTTFKLVWCL